VALVTAETENQLIAVALPGGHVLGRIHLPADPENVEARPDVRVAIVVSPDAGAVALVGIRALRVVRVLHGFRSPHIAALTPSGRYAYVTDDASGKLSVIDLRRRRVVRRVFVGLGAHHLAISPDGRRTWVALGERAHEIAVLDTSSLVRPRLMGRLTPPEAAHDLAFTPSGARVWVTSDESSRVSVFDVRTHRLLKSFAGGSPPQHVAFLRTISTRKACVTSGYSGTMQIRDARTSRLLRTVPTDYGSFNIGVARGGDYLLTSSLMRGTLTVFDYANGRLLNQWHLAPATRDVAVAIH
jgi:YVTN family beta-propeller protein